MIWCIKNIGLATVAMAIMCSAMILHDDLRAMKLQIAYQQESSKIGQDVKILSNVIDSRTLGIQLRDASEKPKKRS